MPNPWRRQPRSSLWKNLQALAFMSLIIGIIAHLFLPGFLNNLSAVPTASPVNLNLPSINDPNSSNPSQNAIQNVPAMSNISGINNALAAGYWIIFLTNGKLQQLSVNSQDYTFIQGLIQSDSKGTGAITIFLVENGKIRQYAVNGEIFSIISNMTTIEIRATNPAPTTDPNISLTPSPKVSPNSTPNATSPATPNNSPNSTPK